MEVGIIMTTKNTFKYTSANLDLKGWLTDSVEAGIITMAQAVTMGNLVEWVSTDTKVKKPNPQRVVNANTVKWETISGLPVVQCKAWKFWPVMNWESTRKLIENEVRKQREAGFKPHKVVIQGYRVIVRLKDKSEVTPKYKSLAHGTLQASPYKGLKWAYSKSECGFYIDLKDVKAS